ncbi:MAG: hypothetical protein V1865_03015 [bacterium]
MSDFSKTILEKIKEEKIKPKSRWEFLLKDYFVWIVSIIFLIVGGLSVSVIIYLLNNNDWDLYKNISHSFLGFLFLTMPYFWILLLIIFGFVVYYNIRHTKQGYNYSLVLIILISLTANIALGGAFYNLGLGHKLDDVLTRAAGPYSKVFCRNTVVWHRPAVGMLVGDVVGVEEQVCYLVDMENNKWEVIIMDTNFPEEYILMPGDRIKVLGDIMKPGVIRAMEIRPIECSCGGNHNFCSINSDINGDSCGHERKINPGRIIRQEDIQDLIINNKINYGPEKNNKE